ncbi:MAG: hypothetical protein HY815_08995 [Candidatus Riflebacteria bacterium]|nr:hypothetical protein [Candidatus Riflebacteria bacterium]
MTYRNLMLLSDAAGMKLRCAPPHDIIDQAVAKHRAAGEGADRIMKLMERAAALIADHPVSRRRRERGTGPVTDIWLWGQGRPLAFESFAERYGPTAAVITGVDILRGLAVLMGMKLIHVPGATGYIDTDYDAKGAAAIRAVDEFDMVIVHVEAADEAAHMGNAQEKVKALQRMDEAIVGPLLEKVRRLPEWRMLVAADHPTLTSTRGHSAIPPLFAFAGTGVPAVEKAPFDDVAAERGGFWVRQGHELMRTFLGR